MVAFKYTFFNQLTEAFVAQLELKNPQWVENVEGSGTFEARIVVPDDEILRSTIRQATTLDTTLMVEADNGVQAFAGYVTKRKWEPATNEIVITAVEWRTYLYRFLVAPLTAVPTSNDVNYTAQEQRDLARRVVRDQTGPHYGKGVPYIDAYVPPSSGVYRDLFLTGTKFRSLGEWVDILANRDRGFEWDVTLVEYDEEVVLEFNTYYPQRGTVVEGLAFEYGAAGNILNYEPLEESSDEVVRRQWAIGEGVAGDLQPYANDTDPLATSDAVLRFDKVTTWSGVADDATLASYARAERTFYNQPVNMFSFTATMNSPHVYSYNKGDRCSIIVKDRWLDMNYDQVRIVQREMFPDTQQVKITVDLSDNTLPTVDEDGSV